MSDREALQAVMDRFIDELWNDRRLDVASEIFKEDATLHVADNDLTGIETIRDDYMRSAQEAFPDLFFAVTDLLFDGNKIAMRYVGSATHRGDYAGVAATGEKFDYDGIAIFHMDGNRIAEVWSHSNRARTLAEL